MKNPGLLVALTALLLIQSIHAEPASAQSTPQSKSATGHCPSCEATSSRFASIMGQKQCAADCQKLCCTGKTAYFKVSGMKDLATAQQISTKINAIDGAEIAKVCLNTPCVVVHYDREKTKPLHLVETIEFAETKVESQKLDLETKGMSCTGCSSALTKKLTKHEGVTSVENVSHETGKVSLFIDPRKLNDTLITAIITESGYKVISE